MGVGLDLIPLNFPLGCGPGSDPPQFPPWVWAWKRGGCASFWRGVSFQGVSFKGVSLAGGSPWQGVPHSRLSPSGGSPWPGGGSIPACTEADPPTLWTESQTRVKTYPWPQLRCGRLKILVARVTMVGLH